MKISYAKDFSQIGFAFGDARKAEVRVRGLAGGLSNSGNYSPVNGRTRANTRISYSTLADYAVNTSVEVLVQFSSLILGGRSS